MKRGTASRVFFGVDKTNEDFGGLLLLSQVTLGKKSGMFDEHKGLCIVDNVLLGKGIARVISVIIRGTSPLSLPDAIANSLSYVKAFGGTEQRNLPDGYTQLEYIESTGTQYIDTGFIPTVRSKAVVEAQYTTLNGSNNTFLFATTVSAQARFGWGIFDGRFIYNFGGWTYSSVVQDTNRHVFTIDAISKKVSIDSTTITPETNPTFSGASTSIYLFARQTSTNVAGGYVFAKIYSAKFYENDTLVHDFIPVKYVSGNTTTYGMYDTVSGTFFTNAGTGEFIAGPEAVPTPDAPMDIVSNNGVLKYGYKSVNMFDKNTALAEGTMWGSSGVEIQNPNYYGSNIMPVIGGHTYTRTTGSGSDNIFKLKDGTTRLITSTSATITAPENAVNWRYNYQNSVDRNAVMVVEGTSLPDEYVPYGGYGLYVDGTAETITDSANHTATVATLLGVGDYRDTQNINTGAITRKVGVKVLDGTENWYYTATNKFSIYLADGRAEDNQGSAYCSHFAYVKSATFPTTDMYFSLNRSGAQCRFSLYYTAYTSADDFKQYLADQYNAGTPVTVIYPLATATTESVTGQTLQVQAGDNTLEITQASLDNLELEAQYQAAVSLTIQEVQDANLDPNVEVTIN